MSSLIQILRALNQDTCAVADGATDWYVETLISELCNSAEGDALLSRHASRVNRDIFVFAKDELSKTATKETAQTQKDIIPPRDSSASINCTALHDEIESDLKTSNYCEQDSDCAVMPLGGSYSSFGCAHFGNKKVDQQKIYKKMDNYVKECHAPIDDCGYGPVMTCVNKKCVGGFLSSNLHQ